MPENNGLKWWLLGAALLAMFLKVVLLMSADRSRKYSGDSSDNS